LWIKEKLLSPNAPPYEVLDTFSDEVVAPHCGYGRDKCGFHLLCDTPPLLPGSRLIPEDNPIFPGARPLIAATNS